MQWGQSPPAGEASILLLARFPAGCDGRRVAGVPGTAIHPFGDPRGSRGGFNGMGIPVGAKMSEPEGRGEGAEEPASLPAHPVLNHVLVWELGGGSVNVNKPFFNGPNNNTGDDVLVYGPFFNATWKPLS